ncbi:MAG: helicase C-terminal domain-containing protein, partial [Acidiferrobacteraceae bacterium]
PRHFGTAVRFVLPDPLSPRPVNRAQDDLEYIEEMDPEGQEKSRTNDEWLNYVARMMQCMVDERTAIPALVLTASYADTQELSSKMEGDSRFWFHEKGENFHTGAAALAEGRVKVLVSPSGWEGRDLRSKDGKTQLVKGIMVTRLPFTPPSPARYSAMVRFYRAIDENKRRQKEPTIGEAAIQKKVDGIMRQESLSRALRKFRQGLGRAPRNFNDRVEYWIADHRFPLPEHWYADDSFLQERREKARKEHAHMNAEGKSPGAGFKPQGAFRRAVSARFQDVLSDATVSRVFIAEGLPDGAGLYVPDVLDIVV